MILYDGECGFCSRAVLFVLRHDLHARFRFASLQSELGQRLLRENGAPTDLSTMVLIDEEGAHTRSTAALRVARGLRWPWSWAYVGIVVPRPIRDAAYRLVAKHRRRFGPAVEACRMPSPNLRERMLE